MIGFIKGIFGLTEMKNKQKIKDEVFKEKKFETFSLKPVHVGLFKKYIDECMT